MQVLSFQDTTNPPSARDPIPGCPVVGSPIPRGHSCPWCATVPIREDLDLQIDITKINQRDVDWIKRNCGYILPEIKQLYLDHYDISDDYTKTLQDYDKKTHKLPSIMKKPKKKTKGFCNKVSQKLSTKMPTIITPTIMPITMNTITPIITPTIMPSTIFHR